MKNGFDKLLVVMLVVVSLVGVLVVWQLWQLHKLKVETVSLVAELIYFLASSKAAWITGGTHLIDGGQGQTCAR